jgi:hypothetical protein
MEIDLHSFLPWWLAGYFPIFFIPLLKFKRIQLRFMIQRRGPPNNWDMVFFSRDMGTWRFTSGTSRGQDFIVRDWSLGSSKDQDAALAALEVHHVFPRIELRALCEGGRLRAEASAERTCMLLQNRNNLANMEHAFSSHALRQHLLLQLSIQYKFLQISRIREKQKDMERAGGDALELLTVKCQV